jgi:hypothetical protein
MGPLGCLVGVVAAPVFAVGGAVVGAVSVDSVDVAHNIIEAQGAPELYQLAVNGPALQALFGEALLAESAKRTGEGPRLAHEAEGGGKVTFHFNAFDLYGDVGDDPRVALRIKFIANVATPDATAHRYIDLTYQGWSRPISEWKADDARLFREELTNAANAIALKALEQLRTQPPSGAAAKVAHARDRRREAAAVAVASSPARALEFVVTEPSTEAAAPEPVAPAMAEPINQSGPQPVVELPRVAILHPAAPPKPQPAPRLVGTMWEYAFHDLIFTRRKRGFTVRAEAMEGGVVVESFQGEGGARANERLTTRTLAFSERRLLPGETLVELGPYLLDPSLLGAMPEDYPLGESREAWRVSRSPVVTERVSVPAGTFEAFRVQLTGERSAAGFIGHSNSMWNSLGVTRFRYTAWFVPEVGRYVKARNEQWNPSGNQTADEVVELRTYRAP